MTMTIGTKLGPYEIVSPLGAGGMGEVYQAKDTRLDRDVAIKVLPEVFSRDPERVARFQREAKVLASLNHPNIAAIHGFEESSEKKFLVLELVEGESLSDRLKRGPLSIDDSLQVARQIAEALEAAHERGIIHRDLKPANVKFTADGQVKVLDFGLAKAMASTDERSGTEVANSPTITADFTRPGVILGTAAYMSPEQARGRAIDKRTDIWAFGCLLFECLSGMILFAGETATDSIGAILHKQPEWKALPPNTPPVIRALLQRCLQKDRKDRLRDIGESWVVINAVLKGEVSGIVLSSPESASKGSRWSRVLPWTLAAALGLALGVTWLTARKPELPVMRFRFAVSEEEPLAAPRWPMFDISADGTRVVYVGRGPSDRRLYLRHIHQLEATPLPNTEDAFGPFFSPDGQWIAFAQQGKLRKISVLGGPAETVCDADSLRGGSWAVDGTIIFAPARNSGLWRVSSAGGQPEQLTEAGAGKTEPSHRWPHFLPDGRTALFTSTPDNSDYDKADIVAISMETLETKVVQHGGTFARYVPSGHLVFARSGTLMAVPFDVKSLETRGQPVPVLEGVFGIPAMGSIQLAHSQNGTLLYLAGSQGELNRSLVWRDRNGQDTPVIQEQRRFRDARISPDQTRIATSAFVSSTTDVWVLELDRQMMLRLTFEDGMEFDPVWSPDSEWIYYAADVNGGVFNVYRRRADGTGSVEQVTSSKTNQRPKGISPDGSILVLVEQVGNGDISYVDLGGEEPQSRPFLATPFEEFDPVISPDGRWIAYVSRESGEFEVYVQPFPQGGRRVKVSANGGFVPEWSADGKELFFRERDRILVASVSVDGQSFQAETPQPLFDVPPAAYSWDFDLASDAQRFLFIGNMDSDADEAFNPIVVVNWFDELKSKVPVSR